MSKYRIVTDGELFAIEKGRFFKRYLSLYGKNIWWSLKDSHEYCWGDEERIKRNYRIASRKRLIREVK